MPRIRAYESALRNRAFAVAASCVVAISICAPALAQSTEEKVQALRAKAEGLPSISVNVTGLTASSSEYQLAQRPFWTDMVPDWSGGKITANLRNMNELNLTGPDVFRLVRTGVVQVADTVANYGAGDLASLSGFDLAGTSPGFDIALNVLKAYSPIVRKDLSNIGIELLGIGPATAQVFWCNGELTGMESLRGKRIRLSSSTIGDLVSALGGIPVTMPFAEAAPAMQRGVIDCVITGAATGNSNKYWEVATDVYTLQAGWAPNVRIANARWWNGLDPKVREWLQEATDIYWSEIAIPLARSNTDMGIWCSVGDARCEPDEVFEKADMKLVEVTDADRAKLKQAVESAVLPAFAQACGQACAEAWYGSVGKVLGFSAPHN